jgi:hypothetical protein
MTTSPWARSLVAFLAAVPLAAGADLAGGAREILAPRFFPSWQAFDVCFPFVFQDARSGEYRLYYTGTGDDQLSEATWDRWATGLVTSTDLRLWEGPEDYLPVLAPPALREGELTEGVRRADFDAMAAFGVSVVDDGGSYRMYYTGWAGDDRARGGGVFEKVGFRIGLATSSDGRRWSKQRGAAGSGAVLGTGPDREDALGAGQPFVVKDGAGLRMWYEGYDGVAWRILTATSADGVAWTKQGVALAPGPAGAWDKDGARDPVVVRRRDRLELWYQGWSDGVARVLRATSPDGRTWTRVPGEVRLAPAAGGAIHVDSVLARPDGSALVFFARQETSDLGRKFGNVRRPGFRIYTATMAQ